MRILTIGLAVACLVGCKMTSSDSAGSSAEPNGVQDCDCGSTVALTVPEATFTPGHWDGVVLAVGRASVAGKGNFYTSMMYWGNGFLKDEEALFQEIAAGESEVATGSGSVQVLGNCSGDLDASSASIVHIRGDLESELKVAGHAEVVIGGSVKEGARIVCEGITHVLVGGDVDGEVLSTGSTELWVLSDVSGTIKSGHPSTHIFVFGDFTGAVEPVSKASLLYLSVHGFMAHEKLLDIGKHGYTDFSAVVGSSNVEPGVRARPIPKHGYFTILSESGAEVP